MAVLAGKRPFGGWATGARALRGRLLAGSLRRAPGGGGGLERAIRFLPCWARCARLRSFRRPTPLAAADSDASPASIVAAGVAAATPALPRLRRGPVAAAGGSEPPSPPPEKTPETRITACDCFVCAHCAAALASFGRQPSVDGPFPDPRLGLRGCPPHPPPRRGGPSPASIFFSLLNPLSPPFTAHPPALPHPAPPVPIARSSTHHPPQAREASAARSMRPAPLCVPDVSRRLGNPPRGQVPTHPVMR